VRWILFPEVRVPTQLALFADADGDANELPDIMRVMDLQQEQLARSLGDGHRVIHGVAGSGKTMILGYRAEYLAKASTASSKPILVLCYNEPLA
jgi:superfamily I DNA and RNA helicase